MSIERNAKWRKEIRVKGFDYSRPGAYFVTFCTVRKRPFLSKVSEGTVQLFPIGKALEESWNEIPVKFPSVRLDLSVIMPNHFHCILFLEPIPGATAVSGSSVALGKVVGYLKMRAVKRAREGLSDVSLLVWQHNYYEHIIRDDEDLLRIRQYICDNPLKWHNDEYFVDELD